MTDEGTLAVYVLRDMEPYRVASCDDDSLGFTLRTLTDEGQITRDDMVGILDISGGDKAGQRRWILNPWPSSPLGRRT